MQLAKSRPARPLISLVPMIDVLMIMLVFFMVTSTYLNLDMIQMAESREDAGSGPPPEGGSPAPPRILIRLGADGRAYVRGRPLGRDAVAAQISDRLAQDPRTEIILLPSGHANIQALVSVMDTAVQAGGTRLRVVRLEARP